MYAKVFCLKSMWWTFVKCVYLEKLILMMYPNHLKHFATYYSTLRYTLDTINVNSVLYTSIFPLILSPFHFSHRPLKKILGKKIIVIIRHTDTCVHLWTWVGKFIWTIIVPLSAVAALAYCHHMLSSVRTCLGVPSLWRFAWTQAGCLCVLTVLNLTTGPVALTPNKA